MSSMDYDPLTGLPKKPGTTAAYPGANLAQTFAQGAATGSAGSTGYGATGVAGAPAGGLSSWTDFLANDPFWKQFNADLSAQGISDLAGAQSATRRAVIQYGEAPDLTGEAASWIDPTTRALAAQNTAAGLSAKARIDKQNVDQIRALKSALAARGMLRSGELGHQLRENQGQYERASYDTREGLTSTLANIQSAYAQGQRAAQMQRAQALGQVAGNYYNQPPPAPAAAQQQQPAQADPHPPAPAMWAPSATPESEWEMINRRKVYQPV